MEHENWQNRRYHPRDRRYNNQNERPYDSRHRESPYDKHNRDYSRNSTNRYSTSSNVTRRDVPFVSISPLEVKASKLIKAVKSQTGIQGQLVFLQTDKDHAVVILQNSLHSIKNGVLTIVPGKSPQHFELKINGELIVEGEFVNKHVAKSMLSELAFEKLKKTCFLIIKKRHYEEVSLRDISESQSKFQAPNTLEGSKAHQMMLKMGWGGKGLGINEQGTERTVAETMVENVSKEGLGGKSMSNVNHILKEFARSTKVTTLAFNSSFTKEERAHIHSLAGKLNLKSKSEGHGEDRRITIEKKIPRWDLVKELLLANCENEAFKLIIPPIFENIWTD